MRQMWSASWRPLVLLILKLCGKTRGGGSSEVPRRAIASDLGRFKLGGDAEDEAGDVVMLANVADECVDVEHHAAQDIGGRSVRRRNLKTRQQSALCIFFVRLVDGFDDSVSKNK